MTACAFLVLAAVSLLVPRSTVASQEPPLRLERLDSIGCIECDGISAFGSIRGLAPLSGGRLAVVDRDEPIVRVFGADGSPETSFGRRGQGPGEVAVPGGLASTAKGTLFVNDLRGPRMPEYALDGSVASERRFESTVLGLRSDPTGRYVTWQVADWRSMTASVHLLGPGDSGPATVLATTRGRVLDEEGRAAAPGVFASIPGPDGTLAIVRPHEYRVEVVGPDGATRLELERDVPRTPRSRHELDSIAEMRRRGPLADPANPEVGAAGRVIDPLRPHFEAGGGAYDARGRLWLHTARGGREASVFDLFARDGSFLGTLRLPVPLSDVRIGHGVLAGVALDPLTGIQRVLRWRIVEPASPGPPRGMS